MISFLISLAVLFGAFSLICLDLRGIWESEVAFAGSFLVLGVFLLFDAVGLYFQGVTALSKSFARYLLAPVGAASLASTLFIDDSLGAASVGAIGALALGLWLASDPSGSMRKELQKAIVQNPDKWLAPLVVPTSTVRYLLIVTTLCGAMLAYAIIKHSA